MQLKNYFDKYNKNKFLKILNITEYIYIKRCVNNKKAKKKNKSHRKFKNINFLYNK